MVTLILLLVSWLILFVFGMIMKNRFLKKNSGPYAMAILMAVTGLFHFIYTRGMVLMMPDFIPYKLELVYLTGVLEILIGVGIVIPRYRKVTGILLIVFFIFILPANVVAAMKHVKLSTATFDGPGPVNLWFRIPLQILFIVWTWYFCVRKVSID